MFGWAAAAEEREGARLTVEDGSPPPPPPPSPASPPSPSPTAPPKESSGEEEEDEARGGSLQEKEKVKKGFFLKKTYTYFLLSIGLPCEVVCSLVMQGHFYVRPVLQLLNLGPRDTVAGLLVERHLALIPARKKH